MKVVWSPLAVEQVEEIAGYIARDDPSAAAKWVDAVFDRAKVLSALPGSGRVVPEVDQPNVREIIFGNYRIIYRVEAARVAVLTVRHVKRLLLDGED